MSGGDPARPAGRPRDALIRITELSKSFGKVRAVDEVSLAIGEGEFFCLLGPSGCGKTTLLRLLAGFETADSGAIELDGRDLASVPPHRRPVNTVFQSYALFPHLTVAGNIGYGLRREGRGRAEIAARVDEMLRLVRLEGFGGRSPAQLSGGQRQRVALARALARRPRVLLLDEPLAALDRRLREETRAELKAIQASLGTTFVMVTHDQDEAMILADRMGVMQAGRLVQAGAPRELYERPRTRFVAGFIGDVNLVEGVVQAVEPGSCRIVAPAFPAGLAAATEPGGSASPGDRVTVAIRPERIALGPAGTGAPGRVETTSHLGATVQLRVATADGTVLLVTRPAAGPEAASLSPGDSVGVHAPPGAAIIVQP